MLAFRGIAAVCCQTPPSPPAGEQHASPSTGLPRTILSISICTRTYVYGSMVVHGAPPLVCVCSPSWPTWCNSGCGSLGCDFLAMQQCCVCICAQWLDTCQHGAGSKGGWKWSGALL